jgi:transposase-like protein
MAKTERPVDVVQLCALWADSSVPRKEVARRLGVSASQLVRLVRRYKMPHRPPEYQQAAADPTPAEIAERARECRERHYAQRRAECDETTRTKIWKWNAGICQPSAGRHMS